MCGIAGQVRANAQQVHRETVERMCAALVHRGPDGIGFHVDAGVALGSRRLAIIDVAHGDQPIYNEDRTVAAVLNGEIYNFRQLRALLERNGHRFATSSDTEVLVHLYEDRGRRLVHDLRGMFAFAIWDTRERRLLLARDRVGKKPLYYFERDGRLSFASELGALLEDHEIPRRIDPQAIDAYLSMLYVPHPLSAVEGVKKLPPATTLIWHEGRCELERYWKLDYGSPLDEPEQVVAEKIREHLRDAVRIRLTSERPLGVFLSGGIDSAAVVATMAELSAAPVKTFSVGFRSDRFNELPHARKVANLFGTDHTEYVLEADAVDVLPRLIRHHGEPFGDSSAVPSFYLAEAARADVTVVLNGDGGDESFAGYNRYVSLAFAARLDRVPGRIRTGLAGIARRLPAPLVEDSWPARARRFAMSLPLDAERRYAERMTFFSEAARRDLYEPEFLELVDTGHARRLLASAWNASTGPSRVNRMLAVDVETYLPGDLLAKMDIATMASSLEARSPFLDHELMEMAARIPGRLKIAGGKTKAALKSALRGTLPDAILERPKRGFEVPLADWLRGPLQSPAREILLDRRTRERGQLRPQVVRQLLDEHRDRRADHSNQLWLLIVLELWQRSFIDRPGETLSFAAVRGYRKTSAHG